MTKSLQVLGVDTGGTFTDFVYFNGDTLRTLKVLSTPHAPEQAILQGIKTLKLQNVPLLVIHGSTVATNAVLERKGVATVYISNAGLADVLTIGRQARQHLYTLQPEPMQPPCPPEWCLAVDCRLAADGSELAPLSDESLARLAEQLALLKPQAVAINLLFSYLDPSTEQAIEQFLQQKIRAEALPPFFITRSSAVLAEYREYERGMATWLNAYTGPLMQGYLQRLQQGLAKASVRVMQSHGATIAAELAAEKAVQLLLSGPAGGLQAALAMGQSAGKRQLLTFDMGGTSTDVALLKEAIGLSSEGTIAGYPVAVPMVDMFTIGAGGGSLAWIDDGGLLHVGPQSAGASPGPACHGQGGIQATVTDANLVLGRLPAMSALGGELTLDVAAAERAVGKLAQALGLELFAAAAGIIRIANEHMAQALRVISLQRGHDPREYCLLPFGGAGGLHVCALADLLAVSEILVPPFAGVLSAFGMLVAPPGRELSHTLNQPLEQLSTDAIHQAFADLETQGREALQREAVEVLECRYSVDVRYQGQSSSLNLIWPNADLRAAFHTAHQQRFGHALDIPLELVTIRLNIMGKGLELPELTHEFAGKGHLTALRVVGCDNPVMCFQRSQLSVGSEFLGPVIISEAVATLFVDAGWQGEVLADGNLLLRKH